MSNKEVSSLFENNALVNSDLYKSLQDTNDKLGGGSFGTTRRISLKGGKFRNLVNGDQVSVSNNDTLNVVIIDAAPVSRTFYDGEYNPEVVTAPTCWSSDTDKPDDNVDAPQASRCADCEQNVKGSGKGESRACRYSQKIAVSLEEDMDNVYQMQLPATSIFGDTKEGKMPMQAYARFLKAHNTPVIAVVTEMKFDENSSVPKLFFSPSRPLEEVELNKAVASVESDATKNAIEMRVFDTDKNKKPKEEVVVERVPRKKKAAPVLEVVEEAEEVEEPAKKVSKKVEETPPEEDKKLSSLMSQWDDEKD
jgi:hypothetical protein|tara:strand:+ start:3999 stop:4922 length:924 start_codon:yes stop_codon:yes gene_type:complete